MQQVFYRSDNLPTGRLTPSNSAFADHCVRLQNYIYLHGTETQKIIVKMRLHFSKRIHKVLAGFTTVFLSVPWHSLVGWLEGQAAPETLPSVSKVLFWNKQKKKTERKQPGNTGLIKAHQHGLDATTNYYYYFASAAVAVDSSHMTASSNQ